MSEPILARIADLVADLNKALLIANATPGLIVRAKVDTVLPATTGQPYRVTIQTMVTQADGPAASTQDAPAP